ncbi:MAG: 2-amino-4-hydroxy-6-hydroxymethyldihydropteridine diphosphokinase [Thermodesulfobacteriota bacterium]
MEHIAYISVGSNMGDRLENCRFGIEELTHSGYSEIMAVSPFYMTEPVDFKDQEWFINAAFKIRTRHDPDDLFGEIRRIQLRAGRKQNTVRFGPRMLDLDILFFDDSIIDSEELVIPHPRMHQRRFVLKPICDIDEAFIHPVLKKTMRQLLDELGKDSQKVVPC